MFIPVSFRIDDEAVLFDFIGHHGFAILITDDAGVPFATHVPLLLDREKRTLKGHIARANPHWKLFDRKTESLAIFTGPHGYISPSWYATSPAVPTWNYTAVHWYGVPSLMSDEATRAVVDETVHKYESHREQPWAYDIPDDYREKLLAGIVGFEIPFGRLEGKFKLSQNRPAADRPGILAGLTADGAESRAIAEWMEKETE